MLNFPARPALSLSFLLGVLLLLSGGTGSAQNLPPVGSAVPTTTETPVPSPAPLYHLAATWKVPGAGGWDYLALDSNARRLYVARQDRVQVIDTETGELSGEVTGLDGAHGVALAPRLGRGFASSGHTNSVVVFDLKTLARLGEPIPVGTKPDALVYVPARDRVFVFNGGGADATLIDAREGKTVGTVSLGGKPEFAVAEGGRVFVNLEDQDEVLAIDVDTLTVENRYPLKLGKRPTGLSLDPDGGRLFIGCGNEKMVVMATEDGTIMGTLTIGKGVDATAFDTRAKLALSANGADGTMTVVDAYKASPKVVGTIATKTSARTIAIDQRTHAVYLAAADFAAATDPGEGSKMVSDTFVILKFDYDGKRK